MSLGTIYQYLDDAKMSLSLAQVALRELLPDAIQKEAALAELRLPVSVWNPLAEKYLGQALKTDDGLRVSELLDAMRDIIHAAELSHVAQTLLEASTREPDLKLGKHRER